MSNEFFIVHKDNNGELQLSSAMSQKDAEYYKMCLEILHGLKTHLVVTKDEFEQMKIGKISPPEDFPH